MNDAHDQLATRIRAELPELERLLDRAALAWSRAEQMSDSLYLDSVALNLHGFYDGLERLFELVASVIDKDLPHGANWHQLLLGQMGAETPGLRPAVITEETQERLQPYLGFRHVARHVYPFRLDPDKMQGLVENAAALWDHLRVELRDFAAFLERDEDERR